MNLIPSILLLNKHKQLCIWPSCTNHIPKTLSFRATIDQDQDHPLYINPNNKESLVEPQVEVTPLGSCFTNSSETASVSTTESDCSVVETIVRGARSERLFFQQDSTSSLLEAQESSGECQLDDGSGGLPYKESVAMVMDSENPYVDFLKSMKEMVEIHGLKDWDCLEELLGWYLRMNEKDNHEFIVGAFVDLLAGISDGCRRGNGGGYSGGSGVLVVDHNMASFSSSASTLSSPISSPNGN